MAKITEKITARADKANSLLCVGLDSAYDALPEQYRNEEYPQFSFNKDIIEKTNEFALAYKPNLAFYESRGDQGLKELKLTMDYLHERYPDVVTIADAKRGDTSNTSAHYAKAIFDWFGFDAVTLHAYMGRESLAPFLDREDKASIILCRTSNPGAKEIQDFMVDGKPLWHRVAEKVVNEWNQKENCMLVIGATYPEEMKAIRALAPQMTFLVPGVGEQGGSVEAVMHAGVRADGKGLIINASRSIIFANDPRAESKRLRDEINNTRT